MLKVDAIGLTVLTRQIASASDNTPRDMKRALGTARRVLPAEATKAARAVYAVKRERIAKAWGISEVNVADLSFVLTGFRKPISLMSYQVREGARALIARVLLGKPSMKVRSGFIAASPAGAVLPWKREGDERLPIKVLYGPSTADMLNNPRVADPLGEAFVRRMTAELLRLLERVRGGRG